jgi:hypothetical protein
VPVAFAEGVREDVANFVESLISDSAEAEALKRRTAELLVECKVNPYVGELMAPDAIPSWLTAAGCAPTSQHTGASRTSGSTTATSPRTALAEAAGLLSTPRAGLHAHRRATQLSRQAN